MLRRLRFKDVFTLLNLFLSLCSVFLLFEGRLREASFLLAFNILVLDIVDGQVARLTGTSNAFGKHFDSVTDFFGSSMIVPFFLYFALRERGAVFAAGVAFLPLFSGVLREIRGRLEDINVRGYFIGYPRNSAGLILVALVNTALVRSGRGDWAVLAAALLLFFLQIGYAPFVGNDKGLLIRMPRMKFYLSFCVLSVAVLAGYGFFWEAVVLFMGFFLISPLVIVEREVWDEVRARIEEARMRAAP